MPTQYALLGAPQQQAQQHVRPAIGHGAAASQSACLAQAPVQQAFAVSATHSAADQQTAAASTTHLAQHRAVLRVSQSLAPCRAPAVAASSVRNPSAAVSTPAGLQHLQTPATAAAVLSSAQPLNSVAATCATDSINQQAPYAIPGPTPEGTSDALPRTSCKRSAPNANALPGGAQAVFARDSKAVRTDPTLRSSADALPRCHCLLIHLKRTGASCWVSAGAREAASRPARTEAGRSCMARQTVQEVHASGSVIPRVQACRSRSRSSCRIQTC